jgi:flagellar assembly protein FliH
MTSSPETRVLRGTTATDVPMARLDTELRSRRGRTDTWLAEPNLQRAFDEAADEARAAARAEGYAIGWAEGRRDATAQVHAEAILADGARQEAADIQATHLRTAVAALSRAAAELEARAVTPAGDLRDAMLHAAVELTETLVGRELALATDPGMDALRRALDLTPSGRPVTARLHPAEAAAVRSALAAGPAGDLGREVVVVSDGSVEAGGCVVDCDATRVDAQISTALDRVRQALGA